MRPAKFVQWMEQLPDESYQPKWDGETDIDDSQEDANGASGSVEITVSKISIMWTANMDEGTTIQTFTFISKSNKTLKFEIRYPKDAPSKGCGSKLRRSVIRAIRKRQDALVLTSGEAGA
ncbi:hypothetical protein FRB99_002181 [Tulasnella sp. 403]|nr:hypothetical protein FRB99_002181 [Tulasnella sp. 403]